jgi:hypothetical protein
LPRFPSFGRMVAPAFQHASSTAVFPPVHLKPRLACGWLSSLPIAIVAPCSSPSLYSLYSHPAHICRGSDLTLLPPFARVNKIALQHGLQLAGPCCLPVGRAMCVVSPCCSLIGAGGLARSKLVLPAQHYEAGTIEHGDFSCCWCRVICGLPRAPSFTLSNHTGHLSPAHCSCQWCQLVRSILAQSFKSLVGNSQTGSCSVVLWRRMCTDLVVAGRSPTWLVCGRAASAAGGADYLRPTGIPCGAGVSWWLAGLVAASSCVLCCPLCLLRGMF